MNKDEVIKTICTLSGKEMTQDLARVAINAVFNAIRDGLKRDGQVRIADFGVFTARDILSRTRQDDGTSQLIPTGHKRIGFMPYRQLTSEIDTVE